MFDKTRINEHSDNIDLWIVVPSINEYMKYSVPLKEYVLVEIMDILFMNALEYEISIPKEVRQIDIELKADAVSNEVKISNHITDIAAISAVLYANQGSTTKAGHKGIGLKYARKTCEENQMTLTSTIDTENSTLSFSIVYQKDE